MNEKGEQKQRRVGWSGLLQYSLMLFGAGIMTGYLLTLCPDTGWRGGKATILLVVSYIGMWFFAVVWFAAIGFELTETKGQEGND